MAGQLSQEEVLDFLCQGGGRVANAALLGHFKLFLRDPRAPERQLLQRRELFKRYVNSVAVVRQEGAVKYVVLRSRYRDLLGEELCPLQPGERGQGSPQVGGGGWGHHGDQEPGGTAVPGGPIALHCSGNGAALYSDAHRRLAQPSAHLTTPVTGLPSEPWTQNSHGSNNTLLSSNIASKETLNMSPIRTSSSGSNANTLAATESTYVLPSVQNLSQNTVLMPPCKTNELHDDDSMFSMKTSAPLISASNNNISLTNNGKIPSSPCDASLPYSNTSSLPSKGFLMSAESPRVQIKSSLPFIDTSSPSNASTHSSNTSSPFNVSMTSNKSPGLQSNTSIPLSKTFCSPSNASVLSSDTSSPSYTPMNSSKTPGLQSNVSIPLTKTSLPPSDASMPFSKASEPPINGYSLANSYSAIYCMESPYCSSKSSSLPESPVSGMGQPWRHLAEGEGITEYSNPAFVSTNMDLERQTHCTEPQSAHFHLNGNFHQGVYSEQEANSKCVEEQQEHSLYEMLTGSSPSPQYNTCTLPSPLQQFPRESGFSSPDVLLIEDPPTSPSPPLPLNDMHGMWMYEMPVFKSIRCQLSLQEMEDFVDQESCGSEGSDSGEGGDCDTEHRDDDDPSSDSNPEKHVQFIEQKCDNTRRCPPNRKFLSIIEQYSKLQSENLLGAKDNLKEYVGSEPNIDPETKKSPYVAKSFLTDQAPVMEELARQPPKHRNNFRFRELMSSSDDELIDRDFERRRRSSRTKRPIILVSPKPDVDMLLTVKSLSDNQFIVNNLADQKASQAEYAPNVNMNPVFKKSFNFKQSSVPLDTLEHDWIVKSASGSWLQVYGLFVEDPQLALRKDFISGYTALHWFAKHGAVEMFHKFVNGAKKAGIELDFNIRSNGGYTPLHIAAIHGHHKVATVLVEKLRVNVKLRDNSGKRAWQYLSRNTSGEVWQLLGAPKGKTIFASRALNAPYNVNTQTKSSHINRKTSLAAFLKPQHQKWKERKQPALREREIYSD